MKPVVVTLFVCLLLPALVGAASPAFAQDEEPPDSGSERAAAGSSSEAEGEGEELASFFATTTVTATGREVDAFDVSTPVAVIPLAEIERRQPENAVDLLRYEPGVDVNGVGPNQARPIIRGQRGLRVLFLENGLRMNNPRRQTDFGEISGLVSMDNVQTVEVVRGPASVLYGTDAIGGVLNLITRAPAYGEGLKGSFAAGFSGVGDRQKIDGSIEQRWDRTSLRLGASFRDGDDYEAAAGSFGDIRLDDEATVTDTGLQDDSVFAHLSYQASDQHQLFGRFNRYRADQTGFGFVEPELIGESDDFRIRILYPFQDFDRYTVGYFGVPSGWADSVDVQLYYQTNERQLQNDIDIVIGVFGPPGTPPSTVEADTLNFTDLDTFGGRAEITRGLGESHLLTYGAEFFEDDSFNTDTSTTVTTIFDPRVPFPLVFESSDDVANAPNATNSSYGVFVQDEIQATDRFKVTVGARYQNVDTRAEPTPGWDTAGLDFDDSSVVGSLNMIFRATEHLNLIGSFGTAFRAPNIIERLFNGPTPEGVGFQILNPNLVSEESENFDVGLKYRRRNAVFELIYFRNDIDDGIVQYFLEDEEIAQLPPDLQQEIANTGVDFVVQQRNIDRLRYEGFELVIGYRSESGFTLGGNYTHIDSERIDSDNPPTGDTFGDKYNAYVRYEPPRGRWWAEYRLRHNGDERVGLDPGEPPPLVGETLPSFTVHALSGGVTISERGRWSHRLSLVIDNLTDELYAEFSNASFFRPQPKRSATLTYRLRF